MVDGADIMDQQGNILIPEMKKLEIKGMKKSPSSVFSWPAFVSNSSTKDVMNPLKNVIQVRSTDSVRSVLWVLIKNKIQSVPVFQDRKYMGSIDMFDLVQYISSAAGHAVVKPDFFQVFKRMSFGDAHISNLITGSKDHSATVTDANSLGTVLDLAVSSNMLHIPVMSKHKVFGLVSQTKIVEYLASNTSSFNALASRKLVDLDLSGTDNVYTVDDNVPTITAFSYMLEKGVRGVAVVNATGQFVDAVNACDVKGLVYGDFFSDLRQPILRYLSKARILLGRNLAPLVCTEDETLGDALQKMAQESVTRVFILDAERRPIQAISLRDILKVLHSTPNVAFPAGGSGSQ
jgi:predicted transcriptional regulator